MSYFSPLCEGELLNLHWDPVVLLQAGPVEMHYTWNGTYTIESGEEVLLWHILHSPPVHLLVPDSAPHPGQHEWYAQSGQISKTAVTLTSKDLAISVTR